MKLVVALPFLLAIGLAAFSGKDWYPWLFQSSRFNVNDVYQDCDCVMGYSIGLIGLIGIKILAPGFYAQKDIKTPVKVACAALIVTQIFNLVTFRCFSCRFGAFRGSRCLL